MVESQRIPHWQLVLFPSAVTDEIVNHHYAGKGTEEDPYSVDWIPNDPRDPRLMSKGKKWTITAIISVATLAITFSSSTFSGAIPQIVEDFEVTEDVALLSVSLFVLGFSIGPMFWAPLSELYGRQLMYWSSLLLCVVFSAGSCWSPNITCLLVLRFLGGAAGSSGLVNNAGVIPDMFEAHDRGLAVTAFASSPFLGPISGSIAGGFIAENAGWRWVDGVTVIFAGLMLILGVVVVPETYAPVLLQRRAKKLSAMTGKVYVSKLDIERGPKSAKEVFRVGMIRPWVLLFLEPIVLLFSLYIAIVYGILYLIFSAFPIVFEEERGWSQGISGLSFVGILIGQTSALLISIYLNKRYQRGAKKAPGGYAAPEARLTPAMIGAPLLPIGLLWFAFTNDPSVPWIVCIIGSSVFGIGQVLVFLCSINYLFDAYTIYAASVMAANAMLRALFGFGFPLFTTYMYDNLGVRWASSIPAFLSLACVPIPFLFYRFGLIVRSRCKYAAEAKRIEDVLRNRLVVNAEAAASTGSTMGEESTPVDLEGEKKI